MGFLFATVGCLALLIQLHWSEALLQCAPNERYVSKTYKGVWQLTQCDDSCPSEIQNLCQKDGNRAVSKMKCNWWDPRTGDTRDEYATCEGCCGESSTTPPPGAVTKDQCQAGERSKTYSLPASRPWNCGICEEKCKIECGPAERLTREMCSLMYAGEGGGNTYTCRCCCKNPPPSCCEHCCPAEVNVQISIKSGQAASTSSETKKVITY